MPALREGSYVAALLANSGCHRVGFGLCPNHTKQMNIYDSYTVVLALTEAQEAIQAARTALIKAEQSLPHGHPAKAECKRMYDQLYASKVECSGGDALAWNIRQTIEQVYIP